MPGPGQAGVIQNSQLARYPRLQPFHQRDRPGQRRIRHRRMEDLVDHHHNLPGPLIIGRAQLIGSTLDGGDDRLLQRTLLRIAEHELGQLLAAGIGEQPDQPRRKVINDKHHASSLPASVRSTAFIAGTWPWLPFFTATQLTMMTCQLVRALYQWRAVSPGRRIDHLWECHRAEKLAASV